MNNEIIYQTNIFILYFIIGIIITLIFDIFRILRKSFKTPNIITYIEDLVFVIITGYILSYVFFYINKGIVRFYMIIALIFGVLMYYITLSKYFIKINVIVINKIKNIIFKIINIIFSPFLFVYKILKTIMIQMIVKNKKINERIVEYFKKNNTKIINKINSIKTNKKKDFKN